MSRFVVGVLGTSIMGQRIKRRIAASAANAVPVTTDARRVGLKRALIGSLLTCAFGMAAAAESAPLSTTPPLPVGDWNFRALLDGKPIGQHRFNVSGQGEDREVTSEATFAVKFLGVTAYRYHHQATERWRNGCLSGLASTTDDDGKASSVRAESQGDELTVQTSPVTQSHKGCVMTFAYWNPAIQARTRLLNVQTGQLETVQIQRVGAGSIEVRGKPVPATAYRITGPAQPIELWYSAQGDWIGLDSSVSGGRKLSYRLQ